MVSSHFSGKRQRSVCQHLREEKFPAQVEEDKPRAGQRRFSGVRACGRAEALEKGVRANIEVFFSLQERRQRRASFDSLRDLCSFVFLKTGMMGI